MEALHRRNIQEIQFRTWFLGVVATGMVAILSYGGRQVFIGALTVGGFIAFYSYLARLFAPLSMAVDIYSRLNRLNSSLRRIFEVINERPSVCERPGAVELNCRICGGVMLEGVSFGYREDLPILTLLNLEIRAGEKIALAGFSGSGKSTIAKLIARLYDVNKGVVRIDGIDVRDANYRVFDLPCAMSRKKPSSLTGRLKKTCYLGKQTLRRMNFGRPLKSWV
jgi:ABC-type multidrug transport system fused ATPase/permease subunit